MYCPILHLCVQRDRTPTYIDDLALIYGQKYSVYPRFMTMVKTSGEAMEEQDHYFASIDFSNACREFYINRQKVTEHFKEEIGKKEESKKTEEKSDKPKCFMDSAMNRLRHEMVSFIDLRNLMVLSIIFYCNDLFSVNHISHV